MLCPQLEDVKCSTGARKGAELETALGDLINPEWPRTEEIWVDAPYEPGFFFKNKTGPSALTPMTLMTPEHLGHVSRKLSPLSLLGERDPNDVSGQVLYRRFVTGLGSLPTEYTEPCVTPPRQHLHWIFARVKHIFNLFVIS